MPSLPIPMIIALVLGFLFAALVLRRDRHWLLAVLVGACALQGLVISLGHHYGVGLFMAVQPVSAMLIPPFGVDRVPGQDEAVAGGRARGAPSRWTGSDAAL